jgi:hypothetical protein
MDAWKDHGPIGAGRLPLGKEDSVPHTLPREVGEGSPTSFLLPPRTNQHKSTQVTGAVGSEVELVLPSLHPQSQI